MGLIRALVAPRAQYPADHDFWYQPVGSTSLTGLRLGAQQALSASPLWGAVSLVSDVIASLPLITYRTRFDGGKDRAPDHPVYDLLHDSPNPLQTAPNWLRVSQVHAMLWGNAYSLIKPGPRGPVDQILPLHPATVRTEPLPAGGLRYLVREADGREKAYTDDEVFHLRGLSLDGTTGLSVMELALESIGVNLAAKQYTARFFGQGAQPLGVLTHPGKLSPGARKNLREDWDQIHGGLQGAHRVAILQEGMTWAKTGVTAVEAELIGTLEWSAADVARFYRVPLHLLQETSKVTSWGTGIEELNLAFVTFSLLPWLVNWQAQIKKDLITSPMFFVEFITEALLRGNTLARYQAYQLAAGGNAPWLTRNEIRELENRNKLPGLDEPLQPMNMGGADSQPPAGAGARAHLQLLLRDAAARLVRREIAAMDREWKRAGHDARAWEQAVTEFYGSHACVVADTLKLEISLAERYAAEQIAALINDGPGVMDDWEAERVEHLTRLALEAQG